MFFGLLAATGGGLADVESNRLALLFYSSFLFLPAAAAALLLPEPPESASVFTTRTSAL